MVNIAPIQTKFICFINDDNFLSFICLDMLLTTNIAKAIDIDTNMNFLKEWDNINCICKELGLNCSAIRNCCLGNSKTSQGFIWKYK